MVSVRLVALSMVVGIVVGFATLGMFVLSTILSRILVKGVAGIDVPPPPGLKIDLGIDVPHLENALLLPIVAFVGGATSGLVARYIASEVSGSGMEAALDSIKHRRGFSRKRVALAKLLTTSIVVGSGGSVGVVGPMAQVGVGISSTFSSIARCSDNDRRLLAMAGLAAGVAATLKAPLAGAIMGIEILSGGITLEARALVYTFASALASYSVVAGFLGGDPIFGYVPLEPAYNAVYVLYFAILGAICGAIGRLYAVMLRALKRAFEKSRIPLALRTAMATTIVGILGISLPQILGPGHGYAAMVLRGDVATIVEALALAPSISLLFVAFIKMIATSITIGSGCSGGLVAPTMFVGSFVGASTYFALSQFLDVPPLPYFVLAGMVSMFAAVGRSPLASIVLVSEATGSLSATPLAIASVIVSYLVGGAKASLYESQRSG